MSRAQGSPQRPGSLSAPDAPAPLSRAEKIVLLIGVGAMMIVTLVLEIVDGARFSLETLLDVALIASFTVFLLSPTAAVALITALVAFAVVVGWLTPAFAALVVAAGMVARTAPAWLMFAFTGVLITVSATVVIQHPSQAPAEVGTSLLIAVIVAAVGLLLRVVSGREHRLHARLREQATAIEQIRRDERLAIADELHDVIAHDLTAIALQARVMDHEHDPVLRAQTQREIGDSARRALRDIRRLITPQGDTPAERTENLEATVAAMVSTLTIAGHTVDVDLDINRPLPRMVDATLSRIVRESATNIMKHSPVGPVTMRIGCIDDVIRLDIRNRHRHHSERDRLPSGKFGTTRLTERVSLLGGEFSSAASGDSWVVRASLPLG